MTNGHSHTCDHLLGVKVGDWPLKSGRFGLKVGDLRVHQIWPFSGHGCAYFIHVGSNVKVREMKILRFSGFDTNRRPASRGTKIFCQEAGSC